MKEQFDVAQNKKVNLVAIQHEFNSVLLVKKVNF